MSGNRKSEPGRARDTREWRLLALALLGPVFLHGLAVASLAAGLWLLWHALDAHSGFYAAAKFGPLLTFLGAAMLWAVIRMRPGGGNHIALTRAEAPSLWDMAGNLARELNAPPPTHLFLDDQYNATALRTPSWLPWRAPRVEITLGLPLMLALDAAQLRAVLAHELGHISHNHSRASRFVWRAMANGQAMLEATGDSFLSGIILGFYRWYGPLLERAGAAFSRRQELQADAAAARLCGKQATIHALIAISAREACHARAVEELDKALETGADVPDVFARMRALLASPDMSPPMRVWLTRALGEADDPASTHPVLAVRLRALGGDPARASLPPMPRDNAFDALFGKSAPVMETRLRRIWRQRMRFIEQDVADSRRQARARLNRLQRARARRGHNARDGISIARWHLALGEVQQALDELRALLARQDMPSLPAYAQALHGVALLRLGDERGMHDLFEAAGRNPEIMAMAAQEAGRWLDGPGAAHDSPRLRTELVRFQTLYETGAREREEVSARTRLVPASLDEDERRGLMEAFAPHAGGIRQVWIAERACRELPAWRHLEVLVEFHPRFWLMAFDGREKMASVAMQIRESLPDFHDFSFSLRLWPFFVSRLFVRHMRQQAMPLLPQAPSPDAHAGGGRADDEKPARTRRLRLPDGVRRPWRSPSGRRGMVMASLALPTLLWYSLVYNPRTRAVQEDFTRAYRQEMQKRSWRKQQAASSDDPEKTLRAYFAARRAHDASPFLPIYTSDTTAMLRGRRITPQAMDHEVRTYAFCGAPRVFMDKDRAVLRYDVKRRHCAPFFLRREKGRWRLDLAAMAHGMRFNVRGQWHFKSGMAPAWAFAFKDWGLDESGYPHPLQERS